MYRIFPLKSTLKVFLQSFGGESLRGLFIPHLIDKTGFNVLINYLKEREPFF